jgi:inward rectifier potassium channel
MFRLVNVRKAELLELELRAVLSWFDAEDAGPRRRYHLLKLEREQVSFFPLSLTAVHAITPDSPLFGIQEGLLHSRRAELLVQVKATDEGSQSTVYARSSYLDAEILWGRRFTSVFTDTGRAGTLAVDVTRLHRHEPATLPDAEAAVTA